VTDATGQPMKNADSQRPTKSARSPILLKVTTQLTTKTMMPVAGKDKPGLAFHDAPLRGSGTRYRVSGLAYQDGSQAGIRFPDRSRKVAISISDARSLMPDTCMVNALLRRRS
jgi:hypothetical protein